MKNKEKTRLLFSQSKMAAMGEMIGNIAHQWRQPLNELGIDLFKMKQSVDVTEQFNNAYNHSKLIIKSMSKTIDDFRNFFNTNRPKEDFFISQAIDDAKILIRGLLERELIAFKVNIVEDCVIYGYRSELTQVMLNLIGNSKDALKAIDRENKIIYIKIERVKDKAKISIMDNGGGIENSILDKIFEPYFTTKHPSTGTGLGLYMSKMIVENMGGIIKAKNIEKNACFEIEIPIKQER